jgi:hypothetical protein
MTSKRAGVLSLLVLLPISAAAPLPSDPMIRGSALGLSSGGGAALTESSLFPMKAQGSWNAGALAEFPLFRFLALGLSLGYRYTAASDLAGGFLYRGHGGMAPGLYLAARTLLARVQDRMDLLGGAAAGVSASFDRYSLTELYFFYPSTFLEPFLEFHFRRLRSQTFSLSAPVRLDFRRDLELSLAFGLELTWRYYLGQRRSQE